jgi:hypothetical protein
VGGRGGSGAYIAGCHSCALLCFQRASLLWGEGGHVVQLLLRGEGSHQHSLRRKVGRRRRLSCALKQLLLLLLLLVLMMHHQRQHLHHNKATT